MYLICNNCMFLDHMTESEAQEQVLIKGQTINLRQGGGSMCVQCVKWARRRWAAGEEMSSITSFLFGGESSPSNIISAKCLLPDPHHHCQQDSIPYPSHIDSINPVHLSSVNKQSYQTQMSPCGYILSDCLWCVDLLCLISICHRVSEHGITGLQNESLCRLWKLVTFVQIEKGVWSPLQLACTWNNMTDRKWLSSKPSFSLCVSIQGFYRRADYSMTKGS